MKQSYIGKFYCYTMLVKHLITPTLVFVCNFCFPIQLIHHQEIITNFLNFFLAMMSICVIKENDSIPFAKCYYLEHYVYLLLVVFQFLSYPIPLSHGPDANPQLEQSLLEIYLELLLAQ